MPVPTFCLVSLALGLIKPPWESCCMSENVTAVKKPAKGRGPGLTQAEIERFLLRLAQTEDPQLAAAYAGRPYATFRKRRQRDLAFRRQWNAAAEGFAAKAEEFFANLELIGIPGPAYSLASLSSSWYYRRMQRDPAFAERVRSVTFKQLGGLLKRALAMSEEDPAMLRYLLDRMGRGVLTPPDRA